MKGGLAFIFALCFMGLFSLPYESWGMPVWPVALMTLLVGVWTGLIPRLEKYRIPLTIIYFTVFGLMWLQSFPRVITPKATLHYMRGLVWMGTFSIVGVISVFFTLKTILDISRDEPNRRSVLFMLAAIFMGAGLAFVSGPGGGGGSMIGWLIAHGLSPGAAETLNLIIRKVGHFTFYGVFAWVVYRSAKAGLGPKVAVRPAVVAFLFVFQHAVFDEVRQSGVDVRTGSPFDVLLDSSGALTFLALSGGFRRGGRMKESPERV